MSSAKNDARSHIRAGERSSEPTSEEEESGKPEGDVESILGKRCRGTLVEYLVKGKGSAVVEASCWEPQAHLTIAELQELVQEFERRGRHRSKRRMSRS